MIEKDNGGPAFPGLHPSAECRYKEEGMTMRDYFAAKAMQGFNANPDCTDMTNEKVAEWSYAIADAMLEARKK